MLARALGRVLRPSSRSSGPLTRAQAAAPAAMWGRTTHRLFGVAGLDPAGNIVLRWQRQRAGAGGWVPAQLVDGALPFPLHAEAAARIGGAAARELIPPAVFERVVLQNVAASSSAVAQTEAKQPDGAAAQLVDLDGNQTMALRLNVAEFPRADTNLRVGSPYATHTYKLFFYSVWGAVVFVGLCQYLRFKAFLPFGVRVRLHQLEDALTDRLRVFTPVDRFLDSWSETALPTPSSADSAAIGEVAAAEVTSSGGGPVSRVKSAAVALGYDAELAERDAARLREQHIVRREQAVAVKKEGHRWALVAWLTSVAAAFFLLFL